jgi:hypothetical protein
VSTVVSDAVTNVSSVDVASSVPVQQGGDDVVVTSKPKKAPKPKPKAKAAAKPRAKAAAKKTTKSSKAAKPKPKAKASAKKTTKKTTKTTKTTKGSKVAKKTTQKRQPAKKKATATKKKVQPPVQETETELDGKKSRRFFKLIYKDEIFGRLKGSKPKQAASKALTAIIKLSKKNGEFVEGSEKTYQFSIQECTRKSKNKVYTYVGRREKLPNPVSVVITVEKDGVTTEKSVGYEYTNKVKKLKMPPENPKPRTKKPKAETTETSVETPGEVQTTVQEGGVEQKPKTRAKPAAKSSKAKSAPVESAQEVPVVSNTTESS